MTTTILIPAVTAAPLRLVDVALGDAAAIAQTIGCRWVERVPTLLTASHSLALLVDEEGVYADPQVHNVRASMLVGPRAHLVGDCLMVREDSAGEWRAPVDPDGTLRMVAWLTEPHPAASSGGRPRLTLHPLHLVNPEAWGVQLDGVRVGWIQLHERGWWTVWGSRAGLTVDGDRTAALMALLTLEGADPTLATTGVEVDS